MVRLDQVFHRICRVFVSPLAPASVIALTLIGPAQIKAAPLFESQLTAPPDFRVEMVYRVPPAQGSWVSLTVETKDRLIASDQFGQLYRITLATPTRRLLVEPLDLKLGFAQGLLFAFDSLYVVVNRNPDQGGSALYRAQDTNGDDRYDKVQQILELEGHGEHGPHAIVLGPDQTSLYLLAGNATRLPPLHSSLVPEVWKPDELLPHLMQTDGAWRQDRPGGWVCRLDPKGQQLELVAIGLRNPYDLAFNANGELFTFDADMEWDLGTPWYRPTRVNHIVNGAEFGWRTGSAKWPDTYTDSLGSVVDVGESSPTGLAFGYGAKFPERFQRALFLGDWSYGKIYALHLEPDGASYRGEYEQFVAGMPLPVTDLVVHPTDGNLYFIVGGRRTPSQLYRVSYHGPQPTAPAPTTDPDPDNTRARRRQLERWYTRTHPQAADKIWDHLGSHDRVLRFAARTGLEHQPFGTWQSRALKETRPHTALAALIALVRCGTPENRPDLIRALARFDFRTLEPGNQLDLLRVYTLMLTRWGEPSTPERLSLLQHLDPLFPAATFDLNRDLTALLIFLHAPDIATRTLDAIENAITQEEALHYALCLRTLPPEHWSLPDLKRYLLWHNQAMAAGGGVTFAEYLIAMRTQILDGQTPDRLRPLTDIINAPPPPSPLDQLKQRTFVQAWTIADLLPHFAEGLSNRNFEQGRTTFAQAMCLKCHRFRGQGGLTGPELTGAAARFGPEALLESILEPSKTISDQYSTVTITTKDGEEYTGRIGDQTDDEVLLKYDLFNPANFETIRYDNIEEIRPSSLSLMPTNLLDYFTLDEILDLLAYLQSQGDPDSSPFRTAARAEP